MRVVNTDKLNRMWKNGVEKLINQLQSAIQKVADSMDVLDTKEEIEANTDVGKMAGALAVKEMVSELDSNLIPKNVTQTLSTGVTFVGALYTQNKRLYIQGYYKKQSFVVGWQDVAILPFTCSKGFQSVASGWKGGSSPAIASATAAIYENKLRIYTLESGLQEITVNISYPI